MRREWSQRRAPASVAAHSTALVHDRRGQGHGARGIGTGPTCGLCASPSVWRFRSDPCPSPMRGARPSSCALAAVVDVHAHCAVTQGKSRLYTSSLYIHTCTSVTLLLFLAVVLGTFSPGTRNRVRIFVSTVSVYISKPCHNYYTPPYINGIGPASASAPDRHQRLIYHKKFKRSLVSPGLKALLALSNHWSIGTYSVR